MVASSRPILRLQLIKFTWGEFHIQAMFYITSATSNDSMVAHAKELHPFPFLAYNLSLVGFLSPTRTHSTTSNTEIFFRGETQRESTAHCVFLQQFNCILIFKPAHGYMKYSRRWLAIKNSENLTSLLWRQMFLQTFVNTLKNPRHCTA